MSTILITGSSGFIGYHLSLSFLNRNHRVIGIDDLNDYYDVNLKKKRQQILEQYPNFSIYNSKIEAQGVLQNIFATEDIDIVIHLAAQAGVRYSIENPRAYLEANTLGTFELLEAIRSHPIKHLLMASTSSVYGANDEMPFEETQRTDHQLSFYAATKKSNETFAHAYSYTYNIPVTMFRFFTVYGPWGRPDMALFKFTKNIIDGRPIDVYNHGDMERDFTYIDDLIHSIVKLTNCIPTKGVKKETVNGDSLSPVGLYRVVNIGNSKSERLMDFITQIEICLDKKANINFLPMQMGDVQATWANCKLLNNLTDYKPSTDIKTGIKNFINWYLDYYKINI